MAAGQARREPQPYLVRTAATPERPRSREVPDRHRIVLRILKEAALSTVRPMTAGAALRVVNRSTDIESLRRLRRRRGNRDRSGRGTVECPRQTLDVTEGRADFIAAQQIFEVR